MTNSEQPKHIRWQFATPDDFRHARVGDWVEGVGDILTTYEQEFVRRFGEAYDRSHPTQIPAPCPQHQIWQHCPVAGEISHKARDDMLNKIKAYADTCIFVDEWDCPGKMNDKEEFDCDGCSYVDYPNNTDICEKIESLRSGVKK